MAQNLNLKANGLYTAPNSFSGVPGGAMVQADDVVIDFDNLLQPRRGFAALEGAFPLNADRANRYARFKGELLSHYGGDQIARYDSGVYTPYSGVFPNPNDDIARARFLQANKNLYVTTATGIWKLDDPASAWVEAGAPRGLDLQLALAGSAGFFVPQDQFSFTAHTQSGNANLTSPVGSGGIAIGNFLSGTNIPAGAKVASITPEALVLSTAGTTAAGSATLAVTGSTTGIAVGQLIAMAGVPVGTTVSSIAGLPNVTMSAPATATNGSPVVVTFTTPAVIAMDQNATGTGTVTVTVAYGSQIAYRVVWGYKDANENLILGAPSQFTAISNTTGQSRNVSGTSSLPAGVGTNYFYQVYRSAQTATISVPPSNEMQQVFEAAVTNTDIANGFVTFTDITPDSLRGAYLYTSEAVEGAAQINLQPPIARDACSFRGFTFYANVTSKQRLKLSVLSVGAPAGVQIGDVLTVGGITYTGRAVESVPAREFAIVTSGTPAQNITDTVNSLLKVVNRSASSVVYGYLESGPTDLPGQVLFEERALGSGSFTATASANGSAYLPALPTSGTMVSSMQDSLPNGIYVSKQNQPEAVPPANLLPLVGSAASDIYRIIPLRDYIVVWKSDGGIFRITGTTLADFSVLPTDLTVNLIAPDSAVPLANAVWAVSDQGIVSITDAGVQVRSRPIEDIINTLFGQAIDEVKKLGTAIGYETDRRYIVSLPDSGGDERNSQTFTFNLFTNAWTRWTKAFSAGFIDPASRGILAGAADSNKTLFERKSGTFHDYIDELLLTTNLDIVVDPFTLQLADITGVQVGDLIYQTDSVASTVVTIDPLLFQVTVAEEMPWVAGEDVEVFPAIRSAVQWVPITAGNPGAIRQYQEGSVQFRVLRFNSADLSFYTENSPSYETVPIVGRAQGGWGLFPWGTLPWGGVVRAKPIRFYVPLDKQYATELNVKLAIAQGWSNWALQSVNLVYENVSEEIAG